MAPLEVAPWNRYLRPDSAKGIVSKATKNRGRGFSGGLRAPAGRSRETRLRVEGRRALGPRECARARGEGLMQGPTVALLLRAGELGAAKQDSTAWYRQEGGPVCSWPRKPQPLERRATSPAPWPRARHSEFRLPEEAPAHGQDWVCSPASARRLDCALHPSAHDSHVQGAEDPRPAGPSPPPAREHAPPQDGEATCGRPSWPKAKSWGRT